MVVVSARAGVTNELLARAKAVCDSPSERELDQLLAVGEQETIALTAMALHGLGVDAVSYTGAQAGIFTDTVHTKARIRDINGSAIEGELKAGRVVIVAGFQGINDEGQTTTLGRGGSDLTAIALAAAVKADKCEIYTDVDGVYTADPRIVLAARKLPELSYEEMLELASSGSKVMQSRSVEFAQKYNVPFEVRSSFNDQPGTIVKAIAKTLEDAAIAGVAVLAAVGGPALATGTCTPGAGANCRGANMSGKDMRAVFDKCRKRGEPAPIPLTCYLIAECCKGLDYAHRAKDRQGRVLAELFHPRVKDLDDHVIEALEHQLVRLGARF